MIVLRLFIHGLQLEKIKTVVDQTIEYIKVDFTRHFIYDLNEYC